MKNAAVSLVAFLGCALGFVDTARADYGISLDNYRTDALAGWAATSGTITVRTKVNGIWSTVCEVHPDTRWAGHWCGDESVRCR